MSSRIDDLLIQISRSPKDAELHQSLGRAYYEGRDYAAAYQAFVQAVELAPNDVWNHLFASTARYVLKDHAQALQHCENALHLAPRLSMIWVCMGDNHAELGQYAAALSCYQTAVDMEPDNETALKNFTRFKRWWDS